MTPSAIRMVNGDGPPPGVAWNQSAKDGNAVQELQERPAAGGTKVSEANNVCMVMIRVGGSERNRIRMATASRKGHDLSMVAARASVLAAWEVRPLSVWLSDPHLDSLLIASIDGPLAMSLETSSSHTAYAVELTLPSPSVASELS